MRQVIRLTERDLHRIIRESVGIILEEERIDEGWKDLAMAGALGAASIFGGPGTANVHDARPKSVQTYADPSAESDSPKEKTVNGVVDKYDGWGDVIDAIIQVESKGDPMAFREDGNCAGILQIRPILVKDCNRIVGYDKYTLDDRFDEEKSKEMFVIIQRHYNKNKDINLAIRMWNVGTVALKDKTKGLGYLKKVLSYYYD